jgi:hypothetical protein
LRMHDLTHLICLLSDMPMKTFPTAIAPLKNAIATFAQALSIPLRKE